MRMYVEPGAQNHIRFLRLARGRSYYVTEPPILAILVLHKNLRIEDIIGTVVDVNLGNEIGIDGWCVEGYSGKKHGKATIYQVEEDSQEMTYDISFSEVIATWKQRYPMK